MTRRKRYVPWLLILLAACIPTGPDPLVVAPGSCQLPCWRMIVPGRTTDSEALAIVQRMDDVYRTTVEGAFIYFGYDERSSNRIHVNKDGVVDWIELELRDTNLSQLVGTFGEPTHILIVQEAEACGFDVFLPAEGLVFLVPCSRSLLVNDWEVGPRARVDIIRATMPGLSIDAMLEVLAGGDQARQLQSRILAWAGYGTYSWPH